MQLSETKFKPGTRVRLVHNPLRIGMLTDAPPRVRNNRRIVQVQFPDILDRVYEDQLEALTEERMNPLDLLADAKLGTPKDLRRTLTHVRLTGRLADLIYSMEATNTDFYAYQFKPVLKLLHTPNNGLLIADEVGLGKTIEAGLIWTELRSRFNLSRLVVLCPAALREKWRDELASKMGLSPLICDAKETLRILKDPQAQARGFTIVASIQGLRPPRDWEDEETKANSSAELARFLEAMENEERLIDLLVVDEAHHMRNSETQTNRIGRLMRSVSEYRVLLTATPIHNHSRDLFSLMHLLDPDTFVRNEDLQEILAANAPLVRARDLVLSGNAQPDDLQALLSQALSSRLLHGNRQLEQLCGQVTTKALASTAERSRIAYRLETVNLLGHSITRTRKRDVKECRVVRDPQPEFVPMTDVEKEFYDLVTEVVTDYSLERDINEAFLLVTPQRQMASCMPAALRSWKERRIEIPEDQLTWTDRDDNKRQQLGPLTTELIARSDEFTSFEALAANDSKYARLREMLQKYFALHPRSKVIVFSTFRGTLSYLSERLDRDGISRIILQGGGTKTKDEVIREFRAPDGPSVLLSSEVGGEGVDLQFCWVVVNYDLPWNPMRVEQRIGRVDRLGQESEKVLIWNLFYADTVDARIYQRLFEKLDLCRSAMGDFEAILGEEVKNLTHDLLTGHLSPDQQEARISQTAQALATLKLEQENLESEAAHLVAYGDYILQQVRAAHEMNRWISGEDLYAYVTDFLNLHYPGYELAEVDAAYHDYRLILTPEAKHDLAEFVARKNLTGQTRLTQAAVAPVSCRFENKAVAAQDRRLEFISQFHPLVRFISERIAQSSLQVRPAVAIKVPAAEVSPTFTTGIYVLACSLWSIQGLRDVEKLVYQATFLNAPDTLLEEREAELLASACAYKGRSWLEAPQECDLAQAHDIANDRLFGTIDELFQQYADDENAQNEDRADVQERNLERHVTRQREVILNAIEKLKARGKTKLIPANEGRLKALEERTKRQKLAIDARRRTTSQSTEIAIAVVRVE